MVRSRLVQIIYRSFELIMGILGVLVAFNIITANPSQGGGSDGGTVFLFFTNLSNFALTLYIFSELIFTIVRFAHGEKEGSSALCLGLKFSLMIAIMLTFLVANIILGFMMPSFGFIWQSRWWTWLTNPFLHFFNPLLFMIDFFLFSEAGATKKTFPLYSLILPLIYVVIVLIRGAVLTSKYGADTTEVTLYPYPFLNPNVNGMGYWWVFLWCLVLSAFFLGLGYLIVFLDHKREKKICSDNEKRTK
jgi:hypothetical protein